MISKLSKIFYKIRKHGIRGSFRIVINIIKWKLSIFWPLRLCFYYNLLKLILVPNFKKKRILGIWDFKALPWDVGDPLMFVEMLSVLKIKHNAEEVDICVVYDRDFPGGNREEGNPYNNLTPENAQDYMFEILPLFSTCPYLGSVYQFSTRREFYYFLKSHSMRYDIFPPLSEHLAETYNYYGGEPNINKIQDFYNSHKFIPFLRIGNRDISWARYFCLKYLPLGSVPIVVSLKRTFHDQQRNADPEIWLAFIDKCRNDFPEVIFVVIGLREEVFAGLRERQNVIIAKDFGTSLIEDLALMRTSLMYLGTASGVNAAAIFSDIPYLIFQQPVEFWQLYKVKAGKNLSFATEKQRIFSTEIKLTPELLFNEFSNLYLQLDQSNWLNEVKAKAREKHSLPTTIVKG